MTEDRVSYHADKVAPDGLGLHYHVYNPHTQRYELDKTVVRPVAVIKTDKRAPKAPDNFYVKSLERAVEGRKYDAGKSPVVQGCFNYFARALKAVAFVSKYGAEKYNVTFSQQNWRYVPNGRSRYTDGDGRHLLDEAIYGLYDTESGLLHAAHHVWNALARLEKMLEDGVPLEKPDGPEQT